MANTTNLVWIDELRFEAVSNGGTVSIDGNSMNGPSPVDLLLASVASCAAADVVDILKKGRQELEAMRVEVTAERRDEHPRYVKKLDMVFRMRGAVDQAKAERAVDLSLEKYCSVFHSLRMDLGVDTRVIIET